MKNHSTASLAKTIDHSLLNPVLTDSQLIEGVELAKKHQVASVCVKPYFVSMAAEILKGSGVAVGAVVGFPHGGHMTSIKFLESQQAIHDGATELDMVVNIGKVLSGDWEYVETDIRAIVNVCKTRGAVSKIIFENCYLEDKHKIKLCELSEKLGASFVKTSTGYGSAGATNEDLKLMLSHVSPQVKVKAAGGIRTLDRLLEVLELGVARVGATATESILAEAVQRFGK